MRSTGRRTACLMLFLVWPTSWAFAGEAISFQHDVMAVLSKSGCNMGACHGNQNGKGGFKLSLRGQDPAADFLTLTRDLSGRRVNPVDPSDSLLLQKPTLEVAHEGGLRFRRDSPEFQILRDWLALGMPRDPGRMPTLIAIQTEPTEVVLTAPQQQFKIRTVGKFSDGSQRDVTRMTVYEPSTPNVVVSPDGTVSSQGWGEVTVIARYLGLQKPIRAAFLPQRDSFVWQAPSPANFIDETVFRKLQTLRINPSAISDDVTFLRRVSLDVTGTLPTTVEAQAFIADNHPDKRERWVTGLLTHKEYADWWALKWSDLLRNEEKTIDLKGVQNFHAWIRESIAQDKPFDQFIREIVASRGSTYSEPASNYYRALRQPLERAETTAQLFLGIRLQCAKCHNHPFDRWTQDDYYSWADVFARIDYKILENNRRDTNDSHEFDGEQIVVMTSKGAVEDPRTSQPCTPRFLGAESTVANDADRLQDLALWLTAPDNRQWARVLVNRVWAHLLGRGIVDPIDDFRATNPPVNSQLLEALVDDFLKHDASLKHLIHTITTSHTYQLSAVPNDTNRDDETNFSRAYVRRLTAEQLLDAFAQVTGSKLEFGGYPAGMRAIEIPGVAVRSGPRRRTIGETESFLRVFGKPQRLQSCDCERIGESTLSQAFQLVSGELVDRLLSNRDNRLEGWLSNNLPPNQIITDLLWTALSRPPTETELASLGKLIENTPDRRQTLEDIVWGVMNSDEFLLRR